MRWPSAGRFDGPALVRHVIILCVCSLFALLPTSTDAQQIHPNRASQITADNAATVMLTAYRPLTDASEVYWSPGNQRLAVIAGRDVLIYPTDDIGAEPQVISHDEPIIDVAWNPDGRILAVASRDDWLRLWSVPGGLIQQQTRLNVRDIDYSADGSVIAYVDFDDGTLNLYNVLDDRVVPLTEVTGVSLPPTGVAFNRTGDQLVQGTPIGDAMLWDVRAGEVIARLEPTSRTNDGGGGTARYPNDATDFAPNGEYVAIGDTSNARRVTLWQIDVAGRPMLWQYAEGINSSSRTVVDVRFSPNSEILAAAGSFYEGDADSPDGVLLFRTRDGIVLNELLHPEVTSVTFSRDGRQIATAGGGMLRLWRLEEDLFTAEELQTFSDVLVDAFCAPGVPQPTADRRDTVTIGWSWYARERAQLQDHIDNVTYTITLNGEPITGWTFLSAPRREADNFDDFTAYWYLLAGQITSGENIVGYEVTWRESIVDGYDAYGPGTARPSDRGQCVFQVNPG